ncbi:M15 family metallopeptidase [Streptomyces rugosispiralis]|uniref:Dipeptidase n=1 Tax=Streptomyces rugosispiralis TaxID=2967341 RepID=A0ABT1V371_9ACTN|nr:M15 family metallopeptidase [Streptomyces rugosispiralis]MCQ8191832.1 dipeptidase [Streptomyces rugosispiralis]
MTNSPFPTDPRFVLISDPRVGAVPVRECGEPLVDCRGRLRVDARRADPAGHFAHRGAGVAERLERAEKSLPNGWRWLLIEGYRPPALQRQIFDGYAATLRMGSPEAATPEESGGACYTHAPGLSPRAREHRAIMIEALSSAGMVNYATEWWHWSYGDRHWAWSTAAPTATYGPAPEPRTDPHASPPEAGEQ